jgi:hypothetical protein
MARVACANGIVEPSQLSVIPASEDSQVLLLPHNQIGIITRNLGYQPNRVRWPRTATDLSTLLDPNDLPQRAYRPQSTFHYSYHNIASQGSMFEIQFPRGVPGENHA